MMRVTACEKPSRRLSSWKWFLEWGMSDSCMSERICDPEDLVAFTAMEESRLVVHTA